jgi:hypothetical protein
MKVFNDYKTVRQFINSGDVVLLKGAPKSLVSKVIMWATNSQYTHVGIAFWMHDNTSPEHQSNRLMFVEAMPEGRRIVNLSFYDDRDFDVYEGCLSWDDISEDAIGGVGLIKYGMIDAFYTGLREKMHNLFRITLPKFNFEGETCSEFVGRIERCDECEISPQVLYEQIVKHKKELKVSHVIVK